jgi:hypothetical protein
MRAMALFEAHLHFCRQSIIAQEVDDATLEMLRPMLNVWTSYSR